MSLTLRIAAIAATTLLFGNASAQQGPLRYAGTAGQQHITLQLELAGDAVRGGQYRYDGQKSDIRIVDSRQFGTTVVLQDEDGNILHLHFEDAGGEKAGSFQAAAMLEGTLDRGDLDLPIKLKRIEAAEPKP